MSYFPRTSVTRHWPILAVAALALYFLAIGPVAVLKARTNRGNEIVNYVYAPLRLLPDPARRVVNAYAGGGWRSPGPSC